MAELLTALQARGLKLAVLSNKADEPTQRIAAALFADGALDAVAGARPDVPLKPDPAGALRAAASPGSSPAGCCTSATLRPTCGPRSPPG